MGRRKSEIARVKVIQTKRSKFFLLRWKDQSGRWREEQTDVPALPSKRRVAERAAADKENELRGFSPEFLVWSAFVVRYSEEHLSHQSKNYRDQFHAMNSRFVARMQPGEVALIDSAVLSRFAATMRTGKRPLRDASINSYIKALMASLNWAKQMGFIKDAPKLRLSSRQSAMRSRPITAEELDRYIMAARKVRPDDYKRWKRTIRWLYLSGLRISEAVKLSWDSKQPFSVQLTADSAYFVISSIGQKSRKEEICPMAPDFADALRRIPHKLRRGTVFRLPFSRHWVQSVLRKIGKRSGIKVNQQGKTVSAHDLRRSFCTRWSMLVKTTVLQRMARHADIDTTLKYYVLHDAKTINDELREVMGGLSGGLVPRKESARVAKDRVSRDDD